MSLSPSQRRYLRGRAHELDPVIRLGARGATQSVLSELDTALRRHELVKVKLSGDSRDERNTQMQALAGATGAENVQQVGHMLLLFRRNEEAPKLALPR